MRLRNRFVSGQLVSGDKLATVPAETTVPCVRLNDNAKQETFEGWFRGVLERGTAQSVFIAPLTEDEKRRFVCRR